MAFSIWLKLQSVDLLCNDRLYNKKNEFLQQFYKYCKTNKNTWSVDLQAVLCVNLIRWSSIRTLFSFTIGVITFYFWSIWSGMSNHKCDHKFTKESQLQMQSDFVLVTHFFLKENIFVPFPQEKQFCAKKCTNKLNYSVHSEVAVHRTMYSSVSNDLPIW